MNPMREWLIIVGAGLGTYMSRALFLLLGDRVTMPPFVKRSLRYVAPAAFAGIVAPGVLIGETGTEIEKVLAMIAALLVVWRTRNLVACMIVGMATLWLLQWLGL